MTRGREPAARPLRERRGRRLGRRRAGCSPQAARGRRGARACELSRSALRRRRHAPRASPSASSIALARALARSPRLLVLDEPTSALAGRRGRAAVRRSSAGCASAASRSSTSRTGSARSRRSPTASRCCATGASRPTFARPFETRAASSTRCSARWPTTSRPSTRRAGGATVVRLEGARVFAGSEPFDLELRAGEVLGLTGLIGAGKSELLGALFGLRPLAGGRDPARRRGARARAIPPRRSAAACTSCPRTARASR